MSLCHYFGCEESKGIRHHPSQPPNRVDMTPFGRFLLERRWQLLLTTQGIFTAVVYYKRFSQEPPPPLTASFPPSHRD